MKFESWLKIICVLFAMIVIVGPILVNFKYIKLDMSYPD